MRVRASFLLPLAAVGAVASLPTTTTSPSPSSSRSPAFWPAAVGEPHSAAPARRPVRAHRLAVVRRPVILSHRPGSQARLRVGPTTEFGSPQVLGVRREAAGLRLRRTRWSLHADLSARTLTLRKGRRRVHRTTVAIGRPGSDTPTGRFAVTDKLSGSRFGPYYGCCILALSGHQPNTPPGWTGGNRLAIHGTDAPATIGAAASAGCLRAADADLRVLMRTVPLGTPVFIRA
jgi:hypothetical protein